MITAKEPPYSKNLRIQSGQVILTEPKDLLSICLRRKPDATQILRSLDQTYAIDLSDFMVSPDRWKSSNNPLGQDDLIGVNES